MASGRARWASKKISAAHLTLPRQPCHRRIGRSARSLWAGRSPARKDSQSGGSPRALAASNSNAHSTLHSPTCRLRRNGRLGCKPSWRTCNGRCSDARARPRQRAGTTRPPRRQSLPTRRPPRQRPGKRPRRIRPRARIRRSGRAGSAGGNRVRRPRRASSGPTCPWCSSGWTCPSRSAAVRTAAPPTCRAGTRSAGCTSWSGTRWCARWCASAMVRTATVAQPGR